MTDVRALLERAIANEQRGEREAARTLYDQVLAVAPEHPGALLKLALFDQAAGDLQAAHARLERSLRAARSSRLSTVPIHLAYAELHEHGNDRTAARAAYEQALAEAPGHPAATFGLGQLALREGDAREAIGQFRAVLARQPDNVPARAQLASALLAQGAVAEAAAELAPAINAIPASAPLRLLAANIALRRSDFAGAIEHCRAGLDGAPGHGGLLTALGHALRATGAADGAAAAFGDAAAAAPDDAA
ncbi:MAG: tetratricopeptide repeat protein, partial [Betaproteobacteria bacterium]